MTVSRLISAPWMSFKETDDCPICKVPLSMALADRTGLIIIHDSSNGSKHPMHATCLKTALMQLPLSRGPEKSCPVCREKIRWPTRKELFFEKITAISGLILIGGAAHGACSYLTGRPLLIATIRGVMKSIVSIESLWIEHKEMGLRYALSIEAGVKLATVIRMIGAPLIASMIAFQITDSIIPQSIIIAALETAISMPFELKFIEPI